MKKLFAVLLAVAMLLSLGVTAFAAGTGTIVVADPPEDGKYLAYKIFDASVATGASGDDTVAYSIAEDSPWFAILFTKTTDADGNVTITPKNAAANFKVTGTSPYTVVAEDGYSPADFAEWLKTQTLPDATASAVNAGNGVKMENLDPGYYLVTPANTVGENHPANDKVTYTNVAATDASDVNNWVSEDAYAAVVGPDDDNDGTPDNLARGAAYQPYPNGCYYAKADIAEYHVVKDDVHATPLTPDFVNGVITAINDAHKDGAGNYETGYTPKTVNDYFVQGTYYVLKAQIDLAEYVELPIGDKANYTVDGAQFQIKAAANKPITATEYEPLSRAVKALYEDQPTTVYYDNSDTNGATYISKALFDSMNATQQGNYTAGNLYLRKTNIDPATFNALAGNANDAKYQKDYVFGSAFDTTDLEPDLTGAVALTTVLNGKTTQIQDKNDMPLDKEVDNGGADGQSGDSNYEDNETAVKVGDILNYKISTKIPANYADGKEYEFLVTDTMSKGLEFQNKITICIGGDDPSTAPLVIVLDNSTGTFTQTVNNTAIASLTANQVYDLIGEPFEMVTTDKTLSGNEIRYGDEEGEPTFELSIATWTHALRQYAGQDMVILYSAEVTEEAKGQLVQNAAVLEYTDENGLHVKDAETDNYIARIVIDKFETGNRSQKLPGADFVLYKVVDETTGEKKYYKIDDDKKVTWESDIANATHAITDANGFAEFLYLEDGTYYLREVKAPVDYARLLDDIEIVVDGSDAVDHRLTQAQRDNILSPVANVANTPGSSMPSTGGVGATLLTIGGVALMLAAGAFLVLRRRKEQE